MIKSSFLLISPFIQNRPFPIALFTIEETPDFEPWYLPTLFSFCRLFCRRMQTNKVNGT